MNKFFITLTFVLCIAFSAFAQHRREASIVKRIEVYLNKMENVGFSGSVLVGMNGKKVLSKGYGYRDQKIYLKNEPSTIFNISSITKQFTASAILKLEMQDKLSIDDRITKYFTNVPKDKVSITIHDLLRHQAGLINSIGKDYDKIDKDDFIKKVFSTKLRFEPGTQFSYSNIGYSLLAIIIEKVAGTSYEDYLYKNLFKPAGMELTGTSRPDFNAENVAVGYYNNDSVWGKPTDKGYDIDDQYWNITGNGSILSNVEDMFKWDKALTTNKILSNQEKQQLYHPKLRADEDKNGNAFYAYGWDVSKTNRHTERVWHNGVNNIMYADFTRFIDERVTIIMLSNRSNQRNFDGKISIDIAGIIFDKNYKPTIPVAENKENNDFTERIIKTVIEKGLQAGKDEFLRRSKGTDLISYIVNNKGYDLINENKIDQAITLFEINAFAFPESADAYDSLAEGYMDKGNKSLAIKYYEKSLALNPANNNAVDMLKKLKK
ncbi:serine hydrolase [Chitinophaga sp. 22321]|uniref:Serine hydrolase n=1 Tax=Chitinophaga hostae TaxID=2831022 RepID=A0ABS5IU22_9BACT|nr:serine hydrolase [Chitinophaga hostae]MBS0026454.1 serine hydrolase [Chitinophaga hostae]